MKVILSRNVIDADRLVTGHGHRSPGSRDPRAIAAHVSLSSRSLVKERRSRTPRNQRPREPGHPARHPDRPPGPALRHTEPQKTARQPVPSREEPPSSFTPRTYGSETRRPQARFPSGKTPPTPPRDPIQTLQGPATEPPAGTTSPQRRRRWPLYRTTNQTLSTRHFKKLSWTENATHYEGLRLAARRARFRRSRRYRARPYPTGPDTAWSNPQRPRCSQLP
jgi:hypothetical protein